MKNAICILIILVVASPALADYHYASHDGSNTYPYTSWATAADSIQKAIDASEAGDTVYVGSGVWEDVPINLREGRALIGMGIDSTIIQKAGNFDFIYTNNDVHIEGFTFHGVDISFGGIAIYSIFDTNVTITNNRFFDIHKGILGVITSGEVVNNIFENHHSAIDAIFSAWTVTFKNNTITGCTEGGVLARNGRWFVEKNIWHHNPGTLDMLGLNLTRQSDTAYVANNLFYRNQGGNPWVNPVVMYLVGEEAVNNTFIGPIDLYYDRAIFAGVSNYEVLSSSNNNSISGFYAAFYVYQGPSEINVSYNNIWDVEYNHTGNGQAHYLEGNIFTDPMYVDSNDFHLQMYSPLIDAGDPTILDVDGSRSDIGCYGGPGGESYQYLDLPPAIPDSIAYWSSNDTIYLDWRMNHEADFFGYMLHRDTVSGFTPSPSNLIAEPESSYYADGEVIFGETYYYRIASLDDQGNLSEYSAEIAVAVTGIGEGDGADLPRMTEIENNYPNPFNEQTIINYYLADLGYQPAEVRLFICDIAGRLVKTLIDERQYPGSCRVSWDGRDEGGDKVSSGIYFARLIVSGVELQRARKIVLLR